MERTFSKQVAGALAFIFALAMAFALAPQAHAAMQAGDLQAAGLAAQAAGTNTSANTATTLKSGKTAGGKFYHAEDTSPSTIQDYWYKFKTSDRTSAYELKLASVDGRMMWVTCFDANMNEFDWDGADGTIVDSTCGYLTDLPKSEWVYFRFSVTKTVEDYNKRFRITVTEYNPLLEYVDGLKVTAKTANSLTLKWNKQANGTRFQVKYRVMGGKWKTETVAKNAVKLTGLAKNTPYQVRVRACGSTGEGFYLDEHKPAKHTHWTQALKVRTAKK